MHDTVINGAKRLGIDINKKRLDKERPPRKTVDTSFEEIENAPVVQESLRFVPVPVDNASGGNEAALLSIQDGGVYFVMSQVDGSQANFHAFVYDSTGTLDGHAEHSGMIIDNRRTSPVYLIEPKDRGTVQSKRNVLNSFFNARVFVMHVYRMLPAVTPVTGALKRVCETGANSDGDDRATKKTRYVSASFQDEVAAQKEAERAS